MWINVSELGFTLVKVHVQLRGGHLVHPREVRQGWLVGMAQRLVEPLMDLDGLLRYQVGAALEFGACFIRNHGDVRLRIFSRLVLFGVPLAEEFVGEQALRRQFATSVRLD